MLFFSKWKTSLILSFCLVSVIFAIINIVPKLSSIFPNQKINLGLDLRGGSHLLLEIDFDYYLKEKLGNISSELKSELKSERIRIVPKIREQKIILNSKNADLYKRIKKIVLKIDNQLKIETDNRYKTEISFSDQQLIKLSRNLVSQSIEIVRRRVDETGTKEPAIQAQGKNRILLQVPGLEDPSQIKNLLGQTAKMTFHFVDYGQSINKNNVKMYDKDGVGYQVRRDVILSGDLLIDANATYYEGEPAVSFRFNNIGTKKFAKITKNNIGKIFAIVLDGKVVTAPRINSIINQGMGVISGSFTSSEANDVALLLRAGALPAPLKIIEERTVGPSLGLDSIKSGLYASVAGLILVAIFMVLFYKKLGVIANIALLVNISLILSVLSLINATLTLPGIAGIVLTIGMAVDSNVLIFERIKEELRDNKNIIVAVDNGFSQAFRTITDSNITTLLAAILLYIFGTGPVRGFAVTLSLGILASMFCAIMLTRLMVSILIRRKKGQQLSI